MTGAASLWVVFLGGSTLAYWLIDFVLTANTLSPIHHDDYAVLGAGLEKMTLFIERPVSTNLAYIMGQLGPNFSFALLNLLTVLVPTGTAVFAFSLLRLRAKLPMAMVFGAMVFGHVAALEHGKYLGLITNLTSHFFGVLTLLLLVRAWKKPSKLRLAFVFAAYALCAFAKEDFLLPPLILILYFAAEVYAPREQAVGIPENRLRGEWVLRGWFYLVGIAVLSVAFNALVRSPFLAGTLIGDGSASHYAANFSPKSLASTFTKLTWDYAYYETIAAGIGFLLLLVGWSKRRREMIVLMAITVSLVLPYAVIANQAPAYRAFAWLPWFAVPVVAAATALWQTAGRLRYSVPAKFGAMILLAVPLLIAYSGGEQRLSVGRWYGNAQRANEAMLATVIGARDEIDREKVVGLVGLQGLSPWSKTDGAYLKNKLGFKNSWIVFIEKPSIFYDADDPSLGGYISVQPIGRLCAAYPSMLIIRFNAAGVGTSERASEFCSVRRSQGRGAGASS